MRAEAVVHVMHIVGKAHKGYDSFLLHACMSACNLFVFGCGAAPR